MSVFRKLFGVLLAALLLGGALKVGGDLGNDPAIEGSLKPEKVHREAAEEIVERLELHYRRLKFDDALSAQVLEQYLQDLDPNRLYFTQQDVDDFQPYRDQLDNQLRDGVLEAGYSIFNRFQSRLEDRLTEILATLEGGFEDWDFDGDGVIDSTGALAAHVYTRPGSYEISLELLDDQPQPHRQTQKLRLTIAP